LNNANIALRLASDTENTSNAIECFAQTQLESINQQLIAESTFLILATCAFFFGAEKQLRKQSGQPPNHSKVILSNLLVKLCCISERNATGITKSLKRLSSQYYLIENIVKQGEQAADQWLNCDNTNNDSLKELTVKYKNLSMFDLGIEGINQYHASEQKKLYASIKQTVGEIRQRLLTTLMTLISLTLAAGIIMIYFIK